MKAIERQCRSLWYAIVHAEHTWCVLCGTTWPVEAHHVVAKGRGNAAVQYDPDFGILLCPHCHRLGPVSAHGCPEAFERLRLLPMLDAMEDKAKADKILAGLTDKTPSRGRVDFKTVRAGLLKRLERAECSWMSDDADEIC